MIYSPLFEQLVAPLKDREGGLTNNKKDNGGLTKFGISQRSYPDLDIKNLTWEEAKQIYWNDFWRVITGDRLEPHLADFMFDFAVNSGAKAAAKALQRAVGALPDGILGVKTLAAIGSIPPRQIVRLVFVERALVFANHEDLQEFGHGWYARLFDMTGRFFTGA